MWKKGQVLSETNKTKNYFLVVKKYLLYLLSVKKGQVLAETNKTKNYLLVEQKVAQKTAYKCTILRQAGT